MEKRRVLLNLGVTFQTSGNLLDSIPGIVRNIIESKDEVLFERADFSAYSDIIFNFEIVYYIISSDYLLFVGKQQEVNFEIYKAFESNNLSVAYPCHMLCNN